MWPGFLLVIVLGFLSSESCQRKNAQNKLGSHLVNGSFGEPLLLTTLLEKGQYKEAQSLARVSPDIGKTTSYSGFFTVNKECESNLFFWFFPAQKPHWKNLPLLLWLQGGPGYSFIFGLFEEVGPFRSYPDGLKKRELSWNVENNLLFIDQPAGTGFSFTKKHCYLTNEREIGEELYQAIKQFHVMFPNFQKNKFFISGESYAGHFIPALGHTIHKYNTSASVNINLSAMMIGNGWMDPVLQTDYASYLYQLGLIDDEGKQAYEDQQTLFLQQVANEEWSEAFKTDEAFTDPDDPLYLQHVSDKVDVYNYIPGTPGPNDGGQNWEEYIQTPEIRKALHVGDVKYELESETVYNALANDSVQSVKPWVEELLEDYPIIFYNGQNDIICGYPMMIKFVQALNWSGQDQYLNASRSHWCVGEEMAGYYKGEHNLYDVLVRNAGHTVPFYQPLWAYTLVNSVTSGNPDNPLHALTQCTKKPKHK